MSRVLPPTNTAGNIDSVAAGLKKSLSESTPHSNSSQTPVTSHGDVGDIMQDYQAVSIPPQEEVKEGVMTLGELSNAIEQQESSELADDIEQPFEPGKYLRESTEGTPRKTGASLAGAALGAMFKK